MHHGWNLLHHPIPKVLQTERKFVLSITQGRQTSRFGACKRDSIYEYLRLAVLVLTTTLSFCFTEQPQPVST
jgi:hypothetical protein